MRAAVNLSMAAHTCFGSVALRCFKTAAVRMLNQTSTWFSQDAWVGV